MIRIRLETGFILKPLCVSWKFCQHQDQIPCLLAHIKWLNCLRCHFLQYLGFLQQCATYLCYAEGNWDFPSAWWFSGILCPVLLYCPISSTGGTVGRETKNLNSGDNSVGDFDDSHLRSFPQMTLALIHSYALYSLRDTMMSQFRWIFMLGTSVL